MSGATDALDRRDTIDMAAAAIMVGLTLSWGLNYVTAKISYAGYDPVFLSVARSIIGGLCVLGWCSWRGISLFTLWFWLLRRYPASGLSSFTFLSPVFGVLSAAVLLNEPLTVRIFLALGLIAAGLIIVNRPARKPTPV